MPYHDLCNRTTESQTGRVGWDLCGSSSPTLLLKQGHSEQPAEDRVQACFEYLQRRRIHNLSGQPVPVLRHPQRGRSSSSCSDRTSCASVCAHCPLSCHWAPLKRAWPHPPDTHPADICRHKKLLSFTVLCHSLCLSLQFHHFALFFTCRARGKGCARAVS